MSHIKMTCLECDTSSTHKLNSFTHPLLLFFFLLLLFIVFIVCFFFSFGFVACSKAFQTHLTSLWKRKLFITYLDCQIAHDLSYDLMNNTSNLNFR